MSNSMLDNLPSLFNNAPRFKTLLDVHETQYNKLDSFMDDCINQLYVDTATWGLDFWDKQAGIKTSSFAIDERRKRINSKLSSMKPLTSSLKAIIYDAEMEFKSSFLFDVTLKSEGQFGDVVNFIFQQIDLRKPAHISYELVLDYFSTLSLRVLFNSYFSEKLKHCGSIDIMGKSYDSTLGYSYSMLINDLFNEFFSEVIRSASEKTFMNGNGRSYSEKLLDSFNRYFSSAFLKCSATSVISGNGRTSKEFIIFSMQRYLSTAFLAASEKTVCKGGV